MLARRPMHTLSTTSSNTTIPSLPDAYNEAEQCSSRLEPPQLAATGGRGGRPKAGCTPIKRSAKMRLLVRAQQGTGSSDTVAMQTCVAAPPGGTVQAVPAACRLLPCK